jgi:hypothetical protein
VCEKWQRKSEHFCRTIKEGNRTECTSIKQRIKIKNKKNTEGAVTNTTTNEILYTKRILKHNTRISQPKNALDMT